MTKIRVHEYAKQVNRTSKEVIEELGKINVKVTNHMSMLDNEAKAKLDQRFGKGGSSMSDKKRQRMHHGRQAIRKIRINRLDDLSNETTSKAATARHKVKIAQDKVVKAATVQRKAASVKDKGHKELVLRHKAAIVKGRQHKAATVQHKAASALTKAHKVVTAQQHRAATAQVREPKAVIVQQHKAATPSQGTQGGNRPAAQGGNRTGQGTKEPKAATVQQLKAAIAPRNSRSSRRQSSGWTWWKTTCSWDQPRSQKTSSGSNAEGGKTVAGENHFL